MAKRFGNLFSGCCVWVSDDIKNTWRYLSHCSFKLWKYTLLPRANVWWEKRLNMWLLDGIVWAKSVRSLSENWPNCVVSHPFVWLSAPVRTSQLILNKNWHLAINITNFTLESQNEEFYSGTFLTEIFGTIFSCWMSLAWLAATSWCLVEDAKLGSVESQK